MSTSLLLSVLLVTLWSELSAYQMYQGYIPNGDKVPNPCNRSTTWPGVGHQNVYGSGVRNPFGLDFAANNHTWNQTLCQMDSDGDGRTNGQELGDPNCTWTKGSILAYSINLSHPGVCEPVNSTLCSAKNSWLMDCLPSKMNCPAVNAPGVRNTTLRYPVTSVPAKETTYICIAFALPNDTVSDIIAIEPVVDNSLILHHMVLSACADNPMANQLGTVFECGLLVPSCPALIEVWGAGGKGDCLNSQVGFRIGPGGFQYAVLQLHWNNPMLTTGLTDSSGMKIYTTTQLRPNRGQIALVGPIYLEIPPGQAEVKHTGSCSTICTRHLPRSIFLTSAFLHMHLSGKSGDIRLLRNGNLLQTLVTVVQHVYNTPIQIEFDSPVEVKPGDEIQVNCVFQSIGKNTTTYYGLATSDEMCYGVFAYYPLFEGLGFCGQWRDIDVCNNKFEAEYDSCDMATYMKLIGLLQYVCAENCSSTPCAFLMDGIQATKCPNFTDAKEFVEAFFPSYGLVFENCAVQRPPKQLCTQPQAIVSNSAGQRRAAVVSSLVFTMMAYAAYCSASS